MYSSVQHFYNNKHSLKPRISDKSVKVLPDSQPYITSPLKSPVLLVLMERPKFICSSDDGVPRLLISEIDISYKNNILQKQDDVNIISVLNRISN